jgi:hypothetical protein
MKKFAITGLCLALMVGSASAQSAIRKTAQTSPSSAAKSPSHSQNASARPITDEEAFFYYATIFGAGGDIANRYASYFDTANYKQAMANEFSRARYQEKMQARVESELKRLDFNREFVITGQGVLPVIRFPSPGVVSSCSVWTSHQPSFATAKTTSFTWKSLCCKAQ